MSDRLFPIWISDRNSTLIFAAMDTTSSALSRIIHLLSTHQDVQRKLRQEIVDARSRHGNLEYDELVALPYLDAVCRETLRLWVLSFLWCQRLLMFPLRSYAPVPLVQRTYVIPLSLIIQRLALIWNSTRQDVVLPLSTPIKGLDGREITEIPIPRNTNVIVGILASNRNPEIWGPDSYEWKSERWLTPLPESVSEAHIPGIYSNL